MDCGDEIDTDNVQLLESHVFIFFFRRDKVVSQSEEKDK